MSVAAGGSPGEQPPQGVAAAIAEVSERATLLVREEIELAKTEIAEKTARLARGAAIGVAAGVFLLTALFFVLIGCAWLLYFELPIGNQFTYFWGFFIMAAILVVLAVLAGLGAARAVRSSAPPVPEMAIEQARKIRETVVAGAEAPGTAGSPPAVGHDAPGTAGSQPAAGHDAPGTAGSPPAAATTPAGIPAASTTEQRDA